MKKVGRKLYGWCEDELAVIKQLFIKANRRPHGVKPTLQAIADSLNKDGYKTQMGGKWYAIAVGRIIRKGLAFYQHLHDNPNPRPKEKDRPEPKKHLTSNDYLTKEQIKLCRAVLRDSDRMIFEVLLGSGLRASECCALKLKDIGIFHSKSHQIDVRLGKGAKPRSVGIGPKLKAKLVAYLGATRFDEADKETPIFINRKGKQLTYSNLYDRIRKIRERSGVKCLHPHALRHTFGTHLYNYRMDLELVREQLGHASIATTQIYAKTLTASKIEQMQGYEESVDL